MLTSPNKYLLTLQIIEIHNLFFIIHKLHEQILNFLNLIILVLLDSHKLCLFTQ